LQPFRDHDLSEINSASSKLARIGPGHEVIIKIIPIVGGEVDGGFNYLLPSCTSSPSLQRLNGSDILICATGGRDPLDDGSWADGSMVHGLLRTVQAKAAKLDQSKQRRAVKLETQRRSLAVDRGP
jgi:hypothetical protein